MGDSYDNPDMTLCPRRTLNGGMSDLHWYSYNSQMPRHLISDAPEWINEIPTIPIYYLAKGTALVESAGKEDPLELDSSLTL